jgi:hypothetical protein
VRSFDLKRSPGSKDRSLRQLLQGSHTPDHCVIVTKSVKSVYQNPTYMNPPPTPKIPLANKATLINQVAAPTKAVNQNPGNQVPHATP